MKFNIYKVLCVALAAMLVTVLFSLGASAALNFRSGGISRSSDNLADDTAGEDGIVHEPDTTGGGMNNGGMNNSGNSGANSGNSGSNGSNGSNGNNNSNGNSNGNSGTGEFADDTSSQTGTGSNNTLDSAMNDMDTGASDTAQDTDDGMSVWGVIIVVAIIAAIAILLFSFFARRK